MKLTDQLTDYINAAFTGFWVQTHEADEAEREIVNHAREKKWKVAIWDMAGGLRLPGNGDQPQETATTDPLSALRALPALADPAGTALLVLHNFHRFLNNHEIVQTVFSQLIAGKQQRTFLVVLSPVVQIPLELEKLFVVLEHAFPNREELTRIARELTSDQPADFPQGDQLLRVLDAAAGLTRYEAEGAFALSLTRHNAIRPEAIWELKAQTLRKNNLLTLHRGQETFTSLGGQNNLKDFCRRALRPGRTVKPRGVLLLGLSGTGKSAFAKALGNETGRPTLLLDIGTLMGSLVGQSEANLRQALKIADAMSPCILFCDEIEKGLSGVGSQGDSGVSSRLFGHLLTWLSDHESDVFFIGTSNDISKLPPEFTRAERFDALYFLDLPTASEQDAIWAMYRKHFDIPESQVRPDDRGWTGAEIRACCRLATLLEVPLIQAANNVVPVSVTAAESVERLRTWASGRCLDASVPGVYSRDVNTKVKPSRRVQRGPSDN
jgi:ATPase family associated with various cellular activities (AAA)